MDVGMILFIWIAGWTTVGLAIGARKGRDLAGAVLGFFLGPLGALLAALLKDNSVRLCPKCGGESKKFATVCPHCHNELIAIGQPE